MQVTMVPSMILAMNRSLVAYHSLTAVHLKTRSLACQVRVKPGQLSLPDARELRLIG